MIEYYIMIKLLNIWVCLGMQFKMYLNGFHLHCNLQFVSKMIR